jgi:hypothetical protein
MWHAVEIMRMVESELKSYQATHKGKPKLIATHGNRFILHMAQRSALDINKIEEARKAVPNAINGILERLIAATEKLYEDSYPSNLFKNLTKCEALAEELAAEALVAPEGTGG